MSAFLTAENLSKEYPVKVPGLFFKRTVSLGAVRNVSLSVTKGETLGIVGESGCGKSTVGRLLLGMLEPTKGRVLLDGQPLSTNRNAAWRAQRRRLQMVYQDPLGHLDRRIPVGRQVMEPLDIHFPEKTAAEKLAEAKSLFATVGLRDDQFDHYPHELSGGQRQRVVIARALILNPELVVCDEPVSALDVSVAAQVINLMKDIQRQRGLTYVFISHDLKVVRHIASQVAVMYLGQIVEHGRPEQVFRNPQHPYTQALLASVPTLGKTANQQIPVAGELPSPINVPSGCAFHPRCPFAIERCRIEEPGHVSLPHGHTAACHLVDSERAATIQGGRP